MVNVPTPEFQKLWSKQTEFMRLKYGETTHYRDAEAVMENVREVISAIGRLAGCNLASVGESPKCTLFAQNMVVSRRNLYQLLKGTHLYSALYGVYTEVLHDWTAVLKVSTAKGETAKITITETPSNPEYRQQRRGKRKPRDDKETRNQHRQPWE
jgi:hypothetical protein